jgi:hypothetical protein
VEATGGVVAVERRWGEGDLEHRDQMPQPGSASNRAVTIASRASATMRTHRARSSVKVLEQAEIVAGRVVATVDGHRARSIDRLASGPELERAVARHPRGRVLGKRGTVAFASGTPLEQPWAALYTNLCPWRASLGPCIGLAWPHLGHGQRRVRPCSIADAPIEYR